MKEFAQLLNQLYFTYSNLAKAQLLQQFFRNTPDPERGLALAVIAGTLPFPTFKRALIKELISTKIDPVLFELSYDYVGDLSETIALLWPDNHADEQSDLPTLSEIIKAFGQLQPAKIAIYLSHLLDNCSSSERWALLKLGTGGSLRIGVSERFLKKTLAQYGNVEVSAIEKIWHSLQPPYEELFAWLEGNSSLPELANSIFFHPVMLSHPLSDQELLVLDHQQFAVERKYDGIRVQIVTNHTSKALFSRTGEQISKAFPDLLADINGSVVLDGELIIQHSHGVGSFNDLQQRLNRKTPTNKLMQNLPAGVILYDILAVNGGDLTLLPFNERRLHLEQWFERNQTSRLLLSDLLTMENGQTLLQLKQDILAEKHIAVEGLMLKRKDSPYIPGRPKGYWYKWKRDPHLIDAVLMYAQRGHGKRSSYYSDYTFGLWRGNDLLPIGKAYFGFTDEELALLDKWVRHHTVQRFGPVREVEKALVLEVAFDAVNRSSRHKSGIALRFPRISRIRWDKPASEADILETLEILCEPK
ncbi:cisplatin damage response ATP-dependent DNA ligase [Legionella dresdenensis]|uniref:DNA ligase (ATP) n=1 Tax=Legionella dresdenensis TaxID=450200 RepID=A0ABV8CE46_9GAMM